MRCVLRPGYTWPPEQTLLEQTTLVSDVTGNKVFAEGSANVRGRKLVLPSTACRPPLWLTVLATEQLQSRLQKAWLPWCQRYLAASLLPVGLIFTPNEGGKLRALQAGGEPFGNE